MENNNLTISEAARLLGVSAQTLRRWDDSGLLLSKRNKEGGFRYYSRQDLESILQDHEPDLEKIAEGWVLDNDPQQPLDTLYCSSNNIFQLRLQTLEQQLQNIADIEQTFSLITASVGEMGNNSFDHNLGNWQDVPGIFFGFDKRRRKIVLADRGQGVLVTISRVRPSLQTHAKALKVVFTEVLTGRAPEHRGNGLKFVRKIVTSNAFSLKFKTGNALLELGKGDENLNITETKKSITGCLAILSF